MLLPYTAGRLVARVHDDGEVLSSEHTADGTRLHARVGPALAAELTPPPSADPRLTPPDDRPAVTPPPAQPTLARASSRRPVSADLQAMARLPMLALVLAGLVAGIALLWRARREAAGSRLPWLVLGLVSLLTPRGCARRGMQALADQALDPQPLHGAGPSGRCIWSPCRSWCSPCSASRTHRQTAAARPRRSSTRASPHWVRDPLLAGGPAGRRPSDLTSTQAALAVVQATCAVVVSTVVHPRAGPRAAARRAAVLLPRTRWRSACWPTSSAWPCSRWRSWTAAASGQQLPATSSASAGELLVAYRRPPPRLCDRDPQGGQAPRDERRAGPRPPARARWPRSWSPRSSTTSRWATSCSSCASPLLAALLVGAVLTRLESLEVVRTLEDRVVERTLDLGTREKWFRALVSNASDVVTVARPRRRDPLPDAVRAAGARPRPRAARRAPVHAAAPVDARTRRSPTRSSRRAVRPTGEVTVELTVWHREGHYVETETTVTFAARRPRHPRSRPDHPGHLRAPGAAGAADAAGVLRPAHRARQPHALPGAHRGRASTTRCRGGVAVLFLDLDGFKGVNDAQGHATGDQLLALVGQRLRNAVRPGDMVARLGGDEFGVLVTGEDAEKAARVGGRTGSGGCSPTTSASRATRSPSVRPSASRSTSAATRAPTSCCATPTSRCTARRASSAKPSCVFEAADARRRCGAHGGRGRPAPGGRARRARAALPADRRPR